MTKVKYFSASFFSLFMVIGFLLNTKPALHNTQTEPMGTVSQKEWDILKTGGQHFGPRNAPITIVEFLDFQCSHCRHFAEVLERYRKNHPNEIRVIVHNFPLVQHRQAKMAAVSAECVAKMGNYGKYYKLLFENQSLLANQPWDSLARLASVTNMKAFHACLKNQAMFEKIRKDMQLGFRVGLIETPTIIVNRILYSGPLSYNELNEVVTYKLKQRGK